MKWEPDQNSDFRVSDPKKSIVSKSVATARRGDS